jgi:hypothetical protein
MLGGVVHDAVRTATIMAHDLTKGVESMGSFAGKTVADSAAGQALIEERRHNHPDVGDDSPDFELERHDGTGTLRLSSFRGDRPVVLIFGSLT